jgi:hypothetical protein
MPTLAADGAAQARVTPRPSSIPKLGNCHEIIQFSDIGGISRFFAQPKWLIICILRKCVSLVSLVSTVSYAAPTIVDMALRQSPARPRQISAPYGHSVALPGTVRCGGEGWEQTRNVP